MSHVSRALGSAYFTRDESRDVSLVRVSMFRVGRYNSDDRISRLKSDAVDRNGARLEAQQYHRRPFIPSIRGSATFTHQSGVACGAREFPAAVVARTISHEICNRGPPVYVRRLVSPSLSPSLLAPV